MNITSNKVHEISWNSDENRKRFENYDPLEEHCYSVTTEEIVRIVLTDHTYVKKNIKTKTFDESALYCKQKFSENEICEKFNLTHSNSTTNESSANDSNKFSKAFTIKQKNTVKQRKKKKILPNRKRTNISKLLTDTPVIKKLINDDISVNENIVLVLSDSDSSIEFEKIELNHSSKIDAERQENTEEVILVDKINFDGPEHSEFNAETTVEKDPLSTTSDSFGRIPIEIALEATKMIENIPGETMVVELSDDEFDSDEDRPLIALQCKGCSKVRTTFSKFDKDCSYCGSPKGLLLCIECRRQFTTIRACRAHFTKNFSHRKENPDIIRIITFLQQYCTKCFKCGRHFNNCRSLDAHQSQCRDTYYCSECRCKFYDSKFLIKHMEQTHSDCSVFKCLKCNTKFSSKYLWSDHLVKCNEEVSELNSENGVPDQNSSKSRKNKKTKKYRCLKCGKTLENRAVYNWHMTYVCKKIKITCPKCDYECTQLNDLQEHLGNHAIEKFFTCNKCNWKFATKAQLTQHKQHECQIYNDYLQCQDCNFKSHGNDDMANHLLICTKKKAD